MNKHFGTMKMELVAGVGDAKSWSLIGKTKKSLQFVFQITGLLILDQLNLVQSRPFWFFPKD